jgi:hypothetical protein
MTEVAPMFEKAFRARSVRCEKLRIAIQWNRLYGWGEGEGCPF